MAKLINLPKVENKTFEIKNVSKTEAEILIYDQIGEDWFGYGISAESFTEELNALPKSVKNINIRINSPGGSVFEGYVIYNRLKQMDAKITAYIDGMAASIASLIMLAADEVVMGEVSQIMIHKPMVGTYGNSDTFEKMINRLDDIESQLINAYRRKTGIDAIELRNMIAENGIEGTWMNAEKAVELGFADRIAEVDEEFNAAACAHANTFINKTPWLKNKEQFKNNSDFVKNKINNFRKDIKGFLAR